MGWCSFFLQMDDVKVLIVGTGEVGERRAKIFLREGAEVIIIGNNISKELKDKGAILKPLSKIKKLVDWADIVVIASGSDDLNNYVSSISREKLLNRADFPEKGNLIVPTNFYVDNIQISIFTKGKSPLMARELRKKIEKTIVKEDILQIKLQDYTRTKLKKVLKDQKERKKYLYKIFKDKKINKLIKKGNIKEAEKNVDKLILKLDLN